MATQAILTDQTSNTTSSGVQHTAPCTVWVTGTFDDDTLVVIEGASADTAAKYVKADNVSIPSPIRFNAPGVANFEGRGTYWVRAILEGAGGSTSVSVDTTS